MVLMVSPYRSKDYADDDEAPEESLFWLFFAFAPKSVLKPRVNLQPVDSEGQSSHAVRGVLVDTCGMSVESTGRQQSQNVT
jgi:hypothetical protein